MVLGIIPPRRQGLGQAMMTLVTCSSSLRGILAVLGSVLAMAWHVTAAHADQREDFLAGRTRECPRCDLSGLNFKRRDLSGADLAGANLKDANFHDARLAGARLAGA